MEGKISIRKQIVITFIFRFRRRPIQLVLFVPLGLLSICGLQWSTARAGDRRNFDNQQDLQKKLNWRKAYRNEHD